MKSAFDKNNIKIQKDKQEAMKLYELAHSTVLSESHVLWNSSQVFLLANSFLAGFIGTNLTGATVRSDIAGMLLLSILGIIISSLWFLSYGRTSKYYKFRIAQARQREPEGWMLLGGDTKKFAEGESIDIEEKNVRDQIEVQKYFFKFYERLSSLWIVRILAICFIIFYTIVFLNFLPWKISISDRSNPEVIICKLCH